MTLAPGTKLGSYEIVALIGAGGMGEVYRARDGRLTRDVALKVLPALFANDPERLARFSREANLLATLNHPNIAAIYGFESSDHTPALVLEMVDGPTLADRILRGPIPLDEAVPIAAQIAAALESAHAQGIVHRDLKPANIKVRDDGTVKVLDFGLAKAVAGDSAPAVAAAPTITSPAMTAAGAIMGTAAYMSPEQARGRAVDKRTDVWAFGAVLYEMLTGRRAFDGEDVSDALANVLKAEPDWSALPPSTPVGLVRLLRRSLSKDPRTRLHDIADARLELADLAAPSLEATAPPLAQARSLRGLERAAWAAVAIALAAVSVLLFNRETPPAASPGVLRYPLQPPAKHVFGAMEGLPSAPGSHSGLLSPDGERIVFNATDESGGSALWIQSLDALEARKLAGTENAHQPFWHPDGRSLAFLIERTLFRIDVARGERRQIASIPGGARGGAWSANGSILLFTANARVVKVSEDGGAVTDVPLQRVTGQTGLSGWPAFLPGGRQFLYWLRTTDGAATGVYAGSIDGGVPRLVVASDTQAVFVAPGYVLFARDMQLFRQAFDATSLTATGEATPIVDRLTMTAAVGWADFSASNTGRLAYRSTRNARNQFAWVGRDGKVLRTVGAPGNYRTPALSRDGRRLVYSDVSDGKIKLLDIPRNVTTALTSETILENAPVLSPDDSRVYYRVDGVGLFVKDVNGTAPPVQLLSPATNGPSQVVTHPSLGPSLLFFGFLESKTSQDVGMLPLDGTRKPVVLVATPRADVEPHVSPDNKWLAYTTENEGRYEVQVEPFPPDGKRRWTVSTAGGRQPTWRADGRELFFVSDDRRFYSVAIPERPQAFDIQPTFLFNMNAIVFNARNSYIPAADGRSFLVNTLIKDSSSPINIVSDWMERGK